MVSKFEIYFYLYAPTFLNNDLLVPRFYLLNVPILVTCVPLYLFIPTYVPIYFVSLYLCSASILPTIVGNPTISKNSSTCLEFPPKIRLKSQNPTVGNFKKNFPPKSV